MQVADSVFDEHWPDEIAAILPLLMVGRKDTVSEEGAEDMMKFFAFAVLVELPSQNSLDVLWLAGEKVSLATEDVDFDQIWAFWSCIFGEDVVEELKHTVLGLGHADAV
jgi:hypothetical protein